MVDAFVIIAVCLFFVGAYIASLGGGMFKNKSTIVGAVICTGALVAIFLRYNGVMEIAQ